MIESIKIEDATNEKEIIESFRGELNDLRFNIKKESFKAKQELRSEIKRLGFYDGDENGENISFNIDKVIKYLQGIKDKSWTNLDVKSSTLEKGVWTISIQIAINYINKNGNSAIDIDLIDGIRGKQTRKSVKDFQTKYGLKNKDGLPGRETMNKILELLGNNSSNESSKSKPGNNLGNNNHTDNNSGGSDKGNHEETEKTPENDLGKINNSDDSPLIKDEKCIKLCENLDIQENGNSWNNSDTRQEWNDFENKLNSKLKDRGELECAILRNPKIQKFFGSIINHQGQVTQHIKKRYEEDIAEEDRIKAQKEKNIKANDGKEAVKSWKEYKFESFSQESFEEFILSDEGIAVIIDEIKSHIDTSHENEDGEYYNFYENYPISEKNLEIKLRIAWESKMKSNYYEKNYDEEKKEEMEKKDVLSNKIIGCIEKIIGDSMKSGNSDFNQEVIGDLNGLLSEGIDGAPINEIFSDIELKDSFKEILASKIKIYHSIIKNGKDVNLDTGDKQVDLQLKSYLYIYGSIFYSGKSDESFELNKDAGYYEDILPDVMRCIVLDDDVSLKDKIKRKKFLEYERKQEEARQERDLQRRREIAKRNKERNNNYTPGGGESKPIDNSTKGETGDLQYVSGAQIAERYLNLGDFYVNTGMPDITKNEFARNKAFSVAWKNFINSHSEIVEIITDKDMRKLYDTEKKMLDKDAREEFLNSDIMKGKSPDEIDKIHNTLLTFSDNFDDALKQIVSQTSAMEGETSDKIRNHALGAVIDSVRFIFSDIVEKWKGDSKFEGFKFDESEPVKREGNDIIISGTFNGTAIKIRYDLISGGLFMNSYLHHSSLSKISIGNNSNADFQIGQLESFETILDKHYHTPDISSSQIQSGGNHRFLDQDLGGNSGGEFKGTKNEMESHITDEQSFVQGTMQNVHVNLPSQPGSFGPATFGIKGENRGEIEAIKKEYRNMLNANFDMISDSIIDNTKRQSSLNSTITKFMRTFNIMPDSGGFSSLDFNEGSNLFDLLQIIEMTVNPKDGDIQSLEYFNKECMPTIMKYAYLKWGENNLFGAQRNEENKNDRNKNEQLVRECANDFSQNLGKFKPGGTKNYDSDYQLGFAEFIKENFVKGSKPNWNLDISKMKEFVYSLKTRDKEYSEASDLREELNS